MSESEQLANRPHPRPMPGPGTWRDLLDVELEDIEAELDRPLLESLRRPYHGLLLIRRALFFLETDSEKFARVLHRALAVLTDPLALPAASRNAPDPTPASDPVNGADGVLSQYADRPDVTWPVRFLLADTEPRLKGLVPYRSPAELELRWLPSPTEATGHCVLRLEVFLRTDPAFTNTPRITRDLAGLGVVDGISLIEDELQRALGIVEKRFGDRLTNDFGFRWSAEGGLGSKHDRFGASETGAGWALLIRGFATSVIPRKRVNVAAFLDASGELHEVPDLAARRCFADEDDIIGAGSRNATLDVALARARPSGVESSVLDAWRSPSDLAILPLPRLQDGLDEARRYDIHAETHYQFVQAFARVRHAARFVRPDGDCDLDEAFDRLRDAAFLIDRDVDDAVLPDAARNGPTAAEIVRAMLATFEPPALDHPATAPSRLLPTLATLLHDCDPTAYADLGAGEPLRTSEVWLLTSDETGALRVRFELFETPSCLRGIGDRRSRVFPDRRRIGALALDEVLLESLNLAWTWAVTTHARQRDGDGVDYGRDHWVRWSIKARSTFRAPTLEGGSGGAAFALGLFALLLGETIASDVAVSAALADADGRLSKVEHLPQKLTAAHESGLRAVWVHSDDHGGESPVKVNVLHDIGPRPLLTLYELFTKGVAPWRELWERVVVEQSVLREHVRFLPDHIPVPRTRDFLVETVIEDPDAEGARREHAGSVRLGDDPAALRAEVSIGSVEARPGHPVLLLGGPGLGKTTLVWKQVSERIERLWSRIERGERAGEGLRVPLVLPLGNLSKLAKDRQENLDARSLDERAAEYTTQVIFRGDPAVGAEFARWLDDKRKRGEIELFLDAYDELSDRARAHVNQSLPALAARVATTVTSRFVESLPTLSPLATYHLLELHPRVVRSYVERRYDAGIGPEDARRSGLDEGHRAVTALLGKGGAPLEVARTPLFLEFLCRLADQQAKLPRTRGGLVEQVVGAMLRRSEERRVLRGDVDSVKKRVIHAKQEFLRELMRQHGSLDELPADVDDQCDDALAALADKYRRHLPEDGEDLRRALIEDGVLYALPDDGSTIGVRFVVRSVHEHLWGCVLAERAAGWSEAELKTRLKDELLTDRFANTSRFFIAALAADQRERVLRTVHEIHTESEEDRSVLTAWARLVGELRTEQETEEETEGESEAGS